MQLVHICLTSDTDDKNVETIFKQRNWKMHYFYFNDLTALRDK